uniref:Protein kinase domain-containing protein n=1 Tax=Oryza barthii TaxID=65489 RepID=A0A0D3HNW0_9ORYZ
MEDKSEGPRDISFALLEKITGNFSEKHKLGSGGYGEVYKGVMPTGEEIAVKKLYFIPGLDDVQFKKEFNNLMKVHHQNVVRLVGYCYETKNKHIERNGEFVFSKVEERALCFEHVQLGSLDKHISDESCGLDWDTRYKIIKGICEGLNYLHNGSSNPIYHLDLKPSNILLDKSMIPKIADLGLSRFFATTKTHITSQIKGTLGYMPPEYIERRQITKKFDVFSLGVIIIDIIAGPSGYSKCAEMTSQQFIELVQGNWKKRLHAATSRYASQEADSLQVKTCLEIALRCIDKDRAKRPTISDIVDKMNEIDTLKMSLLSKRPEPREFLGFDPLELRFPFETNKAISCVLQLTNKSDDFVEFYANTNKKYHIQRDQGVMAPWSRCYVIVTLQPQGSAPPNMQCDDMFFVRSRVRETDIGSLDINVTEQHLEKQMGEVKSLPIVFVPIPQPPTSIAD